MKSAWRALILYFALMSLPCLGQALSCTDIDGAAVWSQEPTPVYLGFFGNPYAAESIENVYGIYGSQYEPLSVRNPYGLYGSQYQLYSATNPYTTTPPVIVQGDTVIALLTANPYLDGAVSLAALDAQCTFYASSPNEGGGGGQTPPEAVNLNQHGVTGTWYNPSASGQGIVMEVSPSSNGTGLLFGGWFTYDVTAAGGKRWYSLQGNVSAAEPTSTFPIYQTTGGAFDSPQTPETNPIGQAELVLLDCGTALLGYSFTDGSGRSGVIPLVRLLPNVTCGLDGDNGVPMGAYALSGSWADPGAKGQGLVIEVNPVQRLLFAGWFTYLSSADPNSGAPAQRWYSLQASVGASLLSPLDVGIYESSGGAFDFTGATTSLVGSAELQFVSCSEATLVYSFTSGTNAGLNGTLHLGRVVPAPAGCVLQ